MATKMTHLIPPNGHPRTRTNKANRTPTSTQQTTDPEGTSSTDLRTISIDASRLTSGKGGGALRSIDQKFQVDPNTGTLTLSFPLQVTASRNQCQPSLSLGYSSGSGNGPFGLGWSLSTETVSRKTSKGVPEYKESDTFILSGHDDLVPLPRDVDLIDGYVIKRFRPRVTVEQPDFRIESWTSQSDLNDVYWRTISQVNVVKIYGRTEESRVFDITPDGYQRISSWLLCEVYDPLGNGMCLSYKAEDGAGVSGPTVETFNHELHRSDETRMRTRYIKTIKYGNRTPRRDLTSWNISSATKDEDWLFEVVFDYGEHDLELPTLHEPQPWAVRRDAFSTFTSGFEVRSYRLCRRMLMFHHIREELVLKDYLVSSYSFEYDESPHGSFLVSATPHGHVWQTNGKGAYLTESLPANVYEYTKVAHLTDLALQTMKPIAFQTLPIAQPEAAFRWIDLHGEGLQGILLQLNGAWYYERNFNALNAAADSDDEELAEVDDFGPVIKLGAQPNVTDYDNSFFEDIDGNGLQDLVIVDTEGRLHGYFECMNQNTWTPLQNFPAALNRGKVDTPLQRIDLTGNGRSDLIFPKQENGAFMWHESLGKSGFTRERRSRCPDNFPGLDTTDDVSLTYFADATGDGLTDIIRLSNTKVSYWPNLGHGNFGIEVLMDNCPVFDSDGNFSTQRIRILDVDGSGTADLLYLMPTGGAMVYYNYCGNSWSNGVLVENFPMIDKLSNVFTTDLLGNGTSCLCWTGPQGNEDFTISYLNLGGEVKPHLLNSWVNGIGFSTVVTYSPSTKSYLMDERNGRPWSTKLPFPVHTVSRVVEKDRVIGSTRTTKFRYHDGYYDGIEREFRGFGEVDRWEDEKLLIDGAEKLYKKPTCHTRLWYHTGAEQIGIAPISSNIFGKCRLQSNISPSLDTDELLDAYRALKGRELRTEVYGEVSNDHITVPNSIEEVSYDVRMISASVHGNRPATFAVHVREKLSVQHEREEQNPRTTHELMLERNHHGDLKRSLHIQYGSTLDTTADSWINNAQATSYIKYTETAYTEEIDTAHVFYKPLVCSTKTSHASDDACKSLYDFDMLLNSGLATVVGTLRKGEETRTYYRSQDLSKRLDLGKFEAFAVVDQQFQLAMYKSMYLDVYNKKDNALVGFTFEDFVSKQCGYVDLDADNRAWVPSNQLTYGSNWSIVAKRLREARSTFFVPSGSRDAFQNTATLIMDNYGLLPIQTLDPVGNITKASNDYRVMQPVSVTDANRNRTQVTYDALGQRQTLARMGKVEEAIGDSIKEIPLTLPDDQLFTFLTKPSFEDATRLIGKAGSRSLYCRKPFIHGASGLHVPTFRIDLTRTEHVGGTDDIVKNNGDIILDVTHMDGRGRDIQHASLADWADVKDRWCIHSQDIRDGNGNVISTMQPYFCPSGHYKRVSGMQLQRTINFFDALDRNVGVLNPNHSWSKICRTPWCQTTYDAGDTVLVEDPCADPDVGPFFKTLDASQYTPTWLGLGATSDRLRQAVKQSVSYANKPTTTYVDSRGLKVAVLERGEGRTRTIRFENDVYGYQITQYDALDRQGKVEDSKPNQASQKIGRVVERVVHDVSGRVISQSSMDSGLQIHLLDCVGNELLHRSSRGIQRRSVYDALRRKVETHVRARGASSETLWSKTTYGETESDAVPKNLRTRVATVSDQSGVHSYQYDFKGNCIATSHRMAVEYKTMLDWNSSPAMHDEVYTTTSSFDALDRVSSSTDAVGCSSVRKFNLLGGIRSLYSASQISGSAPIAHVTMATYTADGEPLRIDYGNSAHSAYSYDERTSELLNRRSWRDDKTVLEDITNTYDCRGQLVTVTDAAHQREFFRNCSVLPLRVYQYDDFGRLVEATGRETVNAGSGTGRSLGQVSASSPLVRAELQSTSGSQLCEYVEKYTYDIADNILKVQHESCESSIAGWTRNYMYNEPSLLEPSRMGNRLSSTDIGGATENYGYDDDAGRAGCMTSMSGYSRLGWDIKNKLRYSARQKVKDGTPQTTWYVYDDSGERVRKVTEHEVIGDASGLAARLFKQTIYMGSAEICHIYDGDGKTVQTTTHTSKIDGGSAQSQQFIASIEDYVLTLKDSKIPKKRLIRHHLNQHLEVDDIAQVISYEEYSPFGVSTLLACRSDLEAPRHYRFAAYERDHETGLYVCGARYYVPWLGRWTSPDPVGTADGPNTYAYCANDPVNYTDSKGTMKFWRSSKKKGDEPLIDKTDSSQDLGPDGKKRDGMLGTLNLNLGDVAKMQELREKTEVKHNGILKNAYINAGGVPGIIKKAVMAAVKTAAGLIPGAGSVIQKGIEFGENKLQEKENEKQLTAERTMYVGLGAAAGAEKMENFYQTTLLALRAKLDQDQNVQEFVDAVTRLGVHGVAGLPEQTGSNNNNVEQGGGLAHESDSEDESESIFKVGGGDDRRDSVQSQKSSTNPFAMYH